MGFWFRLVLRRSVFGRPGSDLLSHALRHSIIGAKGFNGRVRDGIGFWDPCNYHRIGEKHCGEFWFFMICWIGSFQYSPGWRAWINENDQDNRAISTGQLHTLLRFHIRPINVVVFHGSRGNARFEGGFLLRCFQQLSRPNIATLQCRWRDNRSTRDSSNPVLSY